MPASGSQVREPKAGLEAVGSRRRRVLGVEYTHATHDYAQEGCFMRRGRGRGVGRRVVVRRGGGGRRRGGGMSIVLLLLVLAALGVVIYLLVK